MYYNKISCTLNMFSGKAFLLPHLKQLFRFDPLSCWAKDVFEIFHASLKQHPKSLAL